MPFNFKLQDKRSQGFTLIELVIVVGILGVLAAIVIPVVTNYLGSGQQEAYKGTRNQLQNIVDQYYISKDNPRYQGQRQYPLKGASKGAGTFYTGDAGTSTAVIAAGISGNPLAGTTGGRPKWVDDGNGTRDGSENVLNDEDATGTQSGWYVAAVSSGGTTYYVDNRDYLIDFDLLVGQKLMRQPPESASSENCSTSTCTGSYLYFVDAAGNVETLLATYPVSSKSGYQGVFP